MTFTISREAQQKIPYPVVCYFQGVAIKSPADSLKYNDTIASLVARLPTIKTDLLNTPEVTGFRRLYSAEPAGEKLVRVIETRGELRRYNNLVDAINIASAETITPLGSHDARDLTDATELHLKLADGSEQLVPSFQKKKKAIPQGDVTYGLRTDTSFTPLAWLGKEDVDNRDFQIKDDTTSLLVTVIGHQDTSEEHNVAIAHRIKELISMSCPHMTMSLLRPTLVP